MIEVLFAVRYCWTLIEDQLTYCLFGCSARVSWIGWQACYLEELLAMLVHWGHCYYYTDLPGDYFDGKIQKTEYQFGLAQP